MENLIPHFPESKAFIDATLQSGGKVLMHCNGGISRAPSFAIAYLMESFGWDYNKAYGYVQDRCYSKRALIILGAFVSIQTRDSSINLGNTNPSSELVATRVIFND